MIDNRCILYDKAWGQLLQDMQRGTEAIALGRVIEIVHEYLSVHDGMRMEEETDIKWYLVFREQFKLAEMNDKLS